jgi:hypothetical protein
MRKLVAILFVAMSAAVTSAPAFAFGGPHPQQQAYEACVANILKQNAADRQAGGGPKTQQPDSVTNCDHFWQREGIIGNGTPPGVTFP